MTRQSDIRVPDIEDFTYRCRVCGFLCTKHPLTEWAESVTKTGDYGSNATPTPAEYAEEIYSSTSISFVAASGSEPAKLSEASVHGFADSLIKCGDTIRIETISGTNDGDYTVRSPGLRRFEVLLSDDDSLTDEAAAVAGTTTISRVIATPSITTGCPFCGSLNSR